MRAYDSALRRRVVRAVERGASARAAAARFEVSFATAARWVRRQREHGHLEPSARAPRPSLLDAHEKWLGELRESEPELSCQGVCDRLADERGVRVHETTLWYWLRRKGITHKKSRS